MTKTFHKRAKALLMSAVMAATSGVVTAAGSLFVSAAGTYAANKVLESSVTEAGSDSPSNEEECTFMMALEENQYTSFTDTPGYTPADLLGTGITTLKFNLKAADGEMVTEFSYFFGASADQAHGYWWDTNSLTEDGEAIKCTPYANEFSVVVTMDPCVELENIDSKFQFQNCYAATINEADRTTKTQKASLTLVSIEANASASEDTSNGTKPDWITEVDPDLPKGAENTGGLYYSSANGTDEYTSVEVNGDMATITTRNSIKYDDVMYTNTQTGEEEDLILTSGENFNEPWYAKEENGGYQTEADIRNAGLPLNSHKFTYADFGFLPGQTVSENAKPVSLSVTLQCNEELSRIMYGGGLNVENGSPADTESAKLAAGVADNAYAGYWYNDVGAETLAECEAAGVEWGIEVGGGTDLAKQAMGSYVTFTWDVPAEVIPYATTKSTDSIAFQLWYGEDMDGNPITTAKIVSAVLTYEDTVTVPYSGVAELSGSREESVGTPVEILYSDMDMEYETTADLYAVQFDITTNIDVNQLVIGVGSSVVEGANFADNWYQSDDAMTPGKLALVNWEPTTAGNRTPSDDYTLPIADYQEATGKRTYTFMWIVPANLASLMTRTDGTISSVSNRISTEQATDNLKIGVWYAGLGENEATSYTISNVEAYYMADDTRNIDKVRMFEDDLVVADSIEVEIGKTKMLEVNIPGCTLSVGNRLTARASLAEDGQNVDVRGVNVGETTLTITTPGGQTKEVTVIVTPVQTEATTTTTAPETTTTTTTTSTTTTTEEILEVLLGDVNVDGRVDISDAVMLNRAVAGVVTLNRQQTLNADCDASGATTSNDSVVLLKFLVSLVLELPSNG